MPKNNYQGVVYTLFYLLDHKEITEHGGSVPGWIKDEEFLDQLKSYLIALDKDEKYQELLHQQLKSIKVKGIANEN